MEVSQLLDYLINFLSPSLKIPILVSEKWETYRSLINTRAPEAFSIDFLKAQDELLQSLQAQRGITNLADLTPVCGNIYLWRGDITTLSVDAVVNAANSGMIGCFVPCHKCIDNAIHTFAGVQLRLECAAIMDSQGYPEPPGKAKITSAYNLPCKHILHTVGPIIAGDVCDRDRALLASCYRSCLELADQHGINSIAFCCISTGEYHFPNEEAADIATQTILKYFAETKSNIKVIFDVFTERDEQIYKRILG